MRLTIISPESVVYDGDAERVNVPGALSPFEILRGHAPIISSLRNGSISYKSSSGNGEVGITGGFVEVSGDEVVACVELK